MSNYVFIGSLGGDDQDYPSSNMIASDEYNAEFQFAAFMSIDSNYLHDESKPETYAAAYSMIERFIERDHPHPDCLYIVSRLVSETPIEII